MKLLRWWSRFWFQSVDLNPLIGVRTCLGLTLFISYLYRFKNLNLWGSEAFLSTDRSLLMLSESFRPLWSWCFWPDQWLLTVQIIFVMGLFLWTFGVGGRPLTILIWVLHMGFIHRNYALIFGADVMAGVFLFYMCGIKTPEAMKNFGLLRKLKNPIWKKESADPLSNTMFRFIQIHLGVIYAYTGFEKLRGLSWWDGTSIWSVLANTQMSQVDLTWLKVISWVIPLIAFSTVVFEIYFPLAVLSKWKKQWLLAGVLFHVGIGYIMALWSFSLVMISLYFVYLDWPSEGFRFWKASQFKTN